MPICAHAAEYKRFVEDSLRENRRSRASCCRSRMSPRLRLCPWARPRGDRPQYLHAGVSSGRRLHSPPAPLRLIVGSVVGLGLHLDPQLIGSRARWQLPVQGGEGRAEREHTGS